MRFDLLLRDTLLLAGLTTVFVLPAVPSPGAPIETVTTEQYLRHPDNYDGQRVFVRGVVDTLPDAQFEHRLVLGTRRAVVCLFNPKKLSVPASLQVGTAVEILGVGNRCRLSVGDIVVGKLDDCVYIRVLPPRN